MYNLLLSQSRRARIWVNNLPSEFVFESIGRVERRFEANTNLAPARNVALELLIPHGGSFDYGLIGGEFVPLQKDDFVVSVRHSGTEGRPAVDSIAELLDNVRIGLPREYAQAVVSGIETIESAATVFPAGQLRVSLAAHGTAGSSVFFFRRLGKTLFRVITAPVLPPDEEQMGEFLDQILKSNQSEGQ